MKVYIGENEINDTIRIAVVNVARKLNLEDIDWKTAHELNEEIQLSGSPLVDLLNNYLMSYRAWVTFIMDHKDRDDYTNEESQKLQTLQANKNQTRQSLKDAVTV